MTWPPTLADDSEALQEHKVDPDLPDTPTVTVEAPCCGRRCAADMVVDLRGVPGTVIRPGGRSAPPRDTDWACDGCRGRVVSSDRNPWKKSQLVRALGAPREVVVAKRARERLHDYMASLPAGKGVKPREYLEGEKRAMADRDTVPGTDPPVTS